MVSVYLKQYVTDVTAGLVTAHVGGAQPVQLLGNSA